MRVKLTRVSSYRRHNKQYIIRYRRDSLLAFSSAGLIFCYYIILLTKL